MDTSGRLLVLIAVCVTLIAILFMLVAIAKVRRDRAEHTSAEFRTRFRQAWQSGDSAGLCSGMDVAADGSIDAQSDLLAALRSCEAEAPESPGSHLAATIARESGLVATLVD